MKKHDDMRPHSPPVFPAKNLATFPSPQAQSPRSSEEKRLRLCIQKEKKKKKKGKRRKKKEKEGKRRRNIKKEYSGVFMGFMRIKGH